MVCVVQILIRLFFQVFPTDREVDSLVGFHHISQAARFNHIGIILWRFVVYDLEQILDSIQSGLVVSLILNFFMAVVIMLQ